MPQRFFLKKKCLMKMLLVLNKWVKIFLWVFVIAFEAGCLSGHISNSRLPEYVVTKIDSINTVYLIYCQKGDSSYKCFSKRVWEGSLDAKKMKVGKRYKLHLESMLRSHTYIDDQQVYMYLNKFEVDTTKARLGEIQPFCFRILCICCAVFTLC